MHAGLLEQLDFSRLDPSVALAFYFRDRGEFDAFCQETRRGAAARRVAAAGGGGARRPSAPLFTIQHSPPTFLSGEGKANGMGGNAGGGGGYNGDDDNDDEEDDDFILV